MHTDHFEVRHIQFIPQEDNHESLAISYTGGYKIWQIDKPADKWSYGPILHSGKPGIIGEFSFPEVSKIMNKMNLSPIGYEHHTSLDGLSMTSYMSVYPVSPKNPRPATDIWQTVSGNIRKRSAVSDDTLMKYAYYIAASLRSMDITISQMSNHYHMQLIQALRDGTEIGSRFSSLPDLIFTANIHSFFLHFGSARDYLATFVARRCNLPSRIDCLSKLVKNLKPNKLPSDSILKHMIDKSLIVPSEDGKEMAVGGWLKQASIIRNDLVHNHPYGSRNPEDSGMIIKSEASPDMLLYWRPIIERDGDGRDALDVSTKIYHDTMHLFGCIVEVLNLDASVPVLDENSILSLEIKTRKL